MTNAQSMAYRLRWAFLVLGGLCWLTGAFWILNILWPQLKVSYDFPFGAGLSGVMGWGFRETWEYGVAVAIYLGAFLITQWVFLAPRRNWVMESAVPRRPLKRAVIVAALLAALLTVGLLAAVLEMAGWWARFSPTRWGHFTLDGWPPLTALGIAWVLWAAIFYVYWRQGDHYTQLGRMLRGLIAGTVLESLVAVPVHLHVLSHAGSKDCYCERGSYTGVVLGGTVLLWCFGPGVALLFLREKYRREKFLFGAGHPCPKCGYDLRGTLAAGRTSCPECGAEIPARTGDRKGAAAEKVEFPGARE